MKKYVNFLCVLILALMFFNLVWGLFFSPGSGIKPKIDPASLSLGTSMFLLVVALLTLAVLAMCFITLVKFILNVNRNQVFTNKNVSLLRKYGVYAIVCGLCFIIMTSFMGILERAAEDCVDFITQGLFALLMGEVFSIGIKLKEGRN